MMFSTVATSAVAAMTLLGLSEYLKGGDVALAVADAGLRAAVADAGLRAKFDVREHYFQRLLAQLLMGTVLITALRRYAEKYRKEEWEALDKSLAQGAPRIHARITQSFTSVSDLSDSGLDALPLPTPAETVKSTILTLSSITSSQLSFIDYCIAADTVKSSQLSITSGEDDESTAPAAPDDDESTAPAAPDDESTAPTSWCGGVFRLLGGLFGALFALVRCVFLCGAWMVGALLYRLFWILFTVLRWAVFLIGQPIVWFCALCGYISRVVARVVGFFFKIGVGVVQMTIDGIFFFLFAVLLFWLVRGYLLSVWNFDLVTLDVCIIQQLHVVVLAITETMQLLKLLLDGTLGPQLFTVMWRYKLQGHWTTIVNLEQAYN
jgi:hypothetical protein